MDGRPAGVPFHSLFTGAHILSRLLRTALAALSLVVVLGLPTSTSASAPIKVAIIVGPVGSLTPTYLALADAAAWTAEQQGAVVARAYSPNATPGNVLAAVADANIVIYFGHGYGYPSPYGGLNTARQNGWGLQGFGARGTHGDSIDGELQYFGEDWIVANARPAPGFVMIYSNTCYAPGASEGGFAPATPAVAAERVAYYSRKVFAMGGSAYYATDFDRGAADLVGRLLVNRHQSYGASFAAAQQFVPSALTIQPHYFSAGQQIWLHRTRYTEGPANYWYAFAGNPDATPIRSWDPVMPTATLRSPAADGIDVKPSSAVTLVLSEPVSGINEATVTLTDGDGRAVPATMKHDVSTGAVTLRPDEPLAMSTRYTVSVLAGAADLAGNLLAPVSWSFTTRLDADPLAESVPIILEPGNHRLIHFGPDGSIDDEQILALDDQRWVVATSRARLPGTPGSWFELGTGDLAGWWTAESSRAHSMGVSEEVSMPASPVTLAPNEYLIADLVNGVPVVAGEVVVRAEREISVDRRVVVDGRTHLRVVDGMPGHSGRWVEIALTAASDEASAIRLLSHEARTSPVRLTLRDGALMFLFDSTGRVIDRQEFDDQGPDPLASDATLNVGGSRFFVITGGDLDGWAVADGHSVTVSELQDPDPS